MTNKEIDILAIGICFIYFLGWYLLLKFII